MNIFDSLFNGKKSKFEETMDSLLEGTVEKVKDIADDKFMKDLTEKFNEVDVMMTQSLEAMRDGREIPEDAPPVSNTEMPDFDASMKKWDGLIDEIEEKELGKYKICPECGEAVPSDGNYCRNCGARLPDLSAAFRVCPKCGRKNRALNLRCENCGAELPLVSEEMSDRQGS